MTETKSKPKVMVENISCILPQQQNLGGLFVGNVYGAQNPTILKEYGIRAVLTSSIQTNINYTSTDIPFHMKIQAHDKQNYNLREHLNECIHFIQETRKFTNIYVHCYAGVSRSVAIVCAYIMWKFKWNYQTTIAFVKAKRIVAKPNDGFVKQLIQIQQILLETSYINRKQVFQNQQNSSTIKHHNEQQKPIHVIQSKDVSSINVVTENVQNKKTLHQIDFIQQSSILNHSKLPLSKRLSGDHHINQMRKIPQQKKHISINQTSEHKIYEKSKPMLNQAPIINPFNKQSLKNTFFQQNSTQKNSVYLQDHPYQTQFHKPQQKKQISKQIKHHQVQLNMEQKRSLKINQKLRAGDDKIFSRTENNFYKSTSPLHFQTNSPHTVHKNSTNIINNKIEITKDLNSDRNNSNLIKNHPIYLKNLQSSAPNHQFLSKNNQFLKNNHVNHSGHNLKSANHTSNSGKRQIIQQGIILGGKKLYNHNSIPIPKVSENKQFNQQTQEFGKGNNGSGCMNNQIYKNSIYTGDNNFQYSQNREFDSKYSLTSPNKFDVNSKYSIRGIQSPRGENIYSNRNDFQSSAPTEGFFNSKPNPMIREAQKSTSRCLVRPKDLPGYKNTL